MHPYGDHKHLNDPLWCSYDIYNETTTVLGYCIVEKLVGFMKTTLNKTIFALELIKNNVFHHILTYEYSQDNLEFVFARIKEKK